MQKSHRTLPALALGAALILSGCHSAKKPPANSLEAMDNELVEGAPVNEGDGSLKDAIKVDPKRAGKAAASDESAEAASPENNCIARTASKLDYADEWASKLPAELPLHPQARLTEAAGYDGDGCHVRAASFTVADEGEAVLAWYESEAKKGGYSAERTQRAGGTWLVGAKGAAAYTVMTGPAKGGATAVDYIWANGG